MYQYQAPNSPPLTCVQAICLPEYEDILPVADVYCLLALCSSSAGAFAVCSKAFIKLESLVEGGAAYQDLAMELFVK